MISTLGAGLATAASLLLAVPAAPVSGAQAVSVPPPGRITISVASVNGSGCRPGSAAVSVAPDNTAFTVTYSEYLAQAGGGSKPADSRRNCQIALRVHVPHGYTYAIASADYRGFASLGRQATGVQQAGYYFQGFPETYRRTHTFNGPLNDNWQATDQVAVGALVYAPCGAERNFNINTELRATTRNAAADPVSFMAMDSTDASINTIYNFAWKQC
ncbi:DUF4360 domain-containing protein [Streptomyces erythrochromogenes]|uniref:DUF4360 domain-containing protein n=1 Tax=Streptomyces erythrochromogenes TaxID=285574 RepID=UPI0036A0D26F